MAGPEGLNVGRVSIRVLPDTSKFRDDLKLALERIEKRVEFNVNTVVDENRLRQSALKAIKSINAKSASRDPGYVIKLRAELDAEDLDARIRRIVREANKQLEIEVKAETSDAERDFGAFIERLDNKTKGHKVEFKASTNERDIHNVREDFQDILDDYDGKDVNFSPDLANIAMAYVRARLTVLTRPREITLAPVVDSKAYAAAMTAIAALSGGRLISETLSNLRRVFENLDKNIPIIGGIAEAIAGLSAWLLSSASNAFALARNLAQIAGAGLALPGIIAGIGFGVGAMVAVLKDFNTVLPEVSKKFSTLQDQMSRDFWGTALKPMRDAINTLFPEFARGMRDTAEALGDSFASLSTALKTHLAGEMTPMFANLAESIKIAGGASDSIAESIQVLGHNGSKYLPRFATWFVEISDGFRDWLVQAEQTGKLEQFIEGGIEQIKQLGRVVAYASSMLTSLAKAAEKAGGSTLTMLADTLERVADYMKSDDFQGGMVDILVAAHVAMKAINEISGPAFMGFWERFADMASGVLVSAGFALGEALRGIGTALNQPAFETGLTDFFSGIQQGIQGLAPMWESLGAAIGTIGSLVGTFAAQFGPIIGSLMEQLAQLVVNVGPMLEETVTALSGMMLDLVNTVGPVLTTLIEVFVNLVGPILQSKVAVGLLVGALALVKFQQGWNTILTWFTSLKGSVGMAAGEIDKMSGKMGKLTKAGSAVAALVGALALVGSGVVNATKTAAPSVDAMTLAIEEYAHQVDVMKTSTSQAVPFVNTIQESFGADPGTGWIDMITNTDTAFRDLNDAMYYYHASTTGFTGLATDLGVALGMTGDKAAAAKEAFDNYDASLAGLVKEGNLEAAALGAEQFTAAAERYKYTAPEIAQMLNDYNVALEENAFQQELAAIAADNAKISQAEFNTAIRDAGGLTPEMSQAVRDSAGAFVDLKTDIDNADVSLGDWITSLEEQVTAHQTFADNIATIASMGYQNVANELAKMGPEGALRAQELVDSTGNELARLDAVMSYPVEQAVTNSGSKFEVMDDKLKEELGKLSPEAKEYLAQLGIDMETYGGYAADGLANGINDSAEKAGQAGQNLADQVIGHAAQRMRIQSPSKVMYEQGAFVVAGLTGGINDNAYKVGNASSEMAGKIKIDNPGEILSKAGASVISGFLAGIRSGFDKVKSTLNNLTSMLPDWKGPAETDATILYNAGELVIGGFVDGLRDHFGDVKDVLGDLTDEIEKADIGDLPFEANAVASLSRSAAARYADSRDESGSTSNKTLIYNAAPGSSLGAEEDLFAAMNRGRSGW